MVVHIDQSIFAHLISNFSKNVIKGMFPMSNFCELGEVALLVYNGGFQRRAQRADVNWGTFLREKMSYEVLILMNHNLTLVTRNCPRNLITLHKLPKSV